jgi:hypothetical protein
MKSGTQHKFLLHLPSSLQGASWRIKITDTDVLVFEENKRRGNLSSLINGRECLIAHSEITPLQSQSREIAS